MLGRRVSALQDQLAGGIQLGLRRVRHRGQARLVECVERRVVTQESRDLVHRGSTYGTAPLNGVGAGSSSACAASVPVLWRCTNQ